MPGHERYEELCALNAIGQLSKDEFEELQEHLRGCSGCRNVGDDFGVILDQLPKLEHKVTSSDAQIVSRARRERFIRQAQVGGVYFTAEAVAGSNTPARQVRQSGGFWLKGSFAFAAAVVVAALGFYYLRIVKSERIQESRQLVSSMHAPVEAGAASRPVPEPRESQKRNMGGQQEPGAKELRKLEQTVEELRREGQQAKEQLALWRNKFAELSIKSDADSQALAEARERVRTLEGSEAGFLASLIEKEEKIEDLSAQMSKQRLAVERERELNGAASDVRQLMAARNLHIIDVADVDKRGKTKKSFGRVFYVEGQSLLFYAFDLDETASPSKVLFQAWGQQEGAGGKPRNLGVFRVDDQAQKRWVLRVDDPKLLASIDSLFVTVEPSPGADQPTGRRLIYAYLGTPANHP